MKVKPPGLRRPRVEENKNTMKITRKNLEKLIKEEMIKVLSETPYGAGMSTEPVPRAHGPMSKQREDPDARAEREAGERTTRPFKIKMARRERMVDDMIMSVLRDFKRDPDAKTTIRSGNWLTNRGAVDRIKKIFGGAENILAGRRAEDASLELADMVQSVQSSGLMKSRQGSIRLLKALNDEFQKRTP